MKKRIFFYIICFFTCVNVFAVEILTAYEKYCSDKNQADFLRLFASGRSCLFISSNPLFAQLYMVFVLGISSNGNR